MLFVDIRVGHIYDSINGENFLVTDIRGNMVLCKYVDKEGIPDGNSVFTWSITGMQNNAVFNPYLTSLYMFEDNVMFNFLIF